MTTPERAKSQLPKMSLIIPLAIFAILVALFWQALGKDPQLLPSALIGKPVPEFALPDLFDASLIQTKQNLPSQPFVLNVWATWCPSCIVEHPFLNQLAAQGVLLVGLNYKDQAVAATEYLNQQGNPFQMVVFDEQGDLGLDLGVYGAPETFFIDHQGQILHRFAGVLTAEVWQQSLAPIYQQMLDRQQAVLDNHQPIVEDAS